MFHDHFGTKFGLGRKLQKRFCVVQVPCRRLVSRVEVDNRVEGTSTGCVRETEMLEHVSGANWVKHFQSDRQVDDGASPARL